MARNWASRSLSESFEARTLMVRWPRSAMKPAESSVARAGAAAKGRMTASKSATAREAKRRELMTSLRRRRDDCGARGRRLVGSKHAGQTGRQTGRPLGRRLMADLGPAPLIVKAPDRRGIVDQRPLGANEHIHI